MRKGETIRLLPCKEFEDVIFTYERVFLQEYILNNHVFTFPRIFVALNVYHLYMGIDVFGINQKRTQSKKLNKAYFLMLITLQTETSFAVSYKIMT